MVRKSSSPRWSGDKKHPMKESSSDSGSPRNYVDFGYSEGDSEAAVERWLTSPVTSARSSPTKLFRSNSRGATSLSKALNSQESALEGDTRTAVSSPGAGRGQELLRQRLRQRFKRELQPTKSTQPKMNVPSSNDRVDFRFNQRKETNTTPTTSASTRTSYTNTFSFSQADSQSPATETVTQSAISPATKSHLFKIPAVLSNNSMNEAKHGRRSIASLNIETMYPATSPRSSVQQVPLPPRNQTSATGTTTLNATKVTPSENSKVQSAPRALRRAGVRQQPLAGDTIVGDDSSPAAREKKVFFVSRGRGDSLSSNSTHSSKSSSPGSNASTEPTNDTSGSKKGVLRDTKRYVAKQQQESDEEREKQDSKVRQTTQQAQHDRRQPLNIPGRTNRIRLHVYDLIADEAIMRLPWGCHFPIGQCFNAVNTGLHTLGTGAYHVGIEINGVEYAYGANEIAGITGVFTCMPKHSPGYQYRSSIDFGDRTLMRQVRVSKRGDESNYSQSGERRVDGREIIREMAMEYMGIDYDLLRKNCCTFAHDACIRMGVKEEEVPSWFRNLCVAGAVTQDAAVSTIQPLTKVFSACDMDGALEDYLSDTGFEVIDGKHGSPEEIIDTDFARS